jgi:hypothetical protein
MTSKEDKSLQEIKVFRAQHGSNPLQVEALAVISGSDVTVIFGGGTHYHIGATALAVPRPSLANPNQTSASASVICVSGHKEDEIARWAALSLASILNCIVVVCVGLHVDEASADDIKIMLDNFDKVSTDITMVLQEYYSSQKTS